MSTWKIDGKELGKAREILLDRREPADITAAISDLEIRNPGFPDDLDYRTWLLKLLDRLNKNLQLPKLFEELARQLELDNVGDNDAKELRRIVENTRPPPETSETPPDVKPGSPPPPAKLDRIILLGESTARSPDSVETSRKALYERLTQALESKNLSVLDWADNWNATRARAAEPDDAKALFVRVVNTDILSDNLASLTALPGKLREKLKLKDPLNPSQILIWNCDGVANELKDGHGAAGADAGGQEPSRDNIRARLDEEKLFLAEHPIDDFVKTVRLRLHPEKWPPPMLRLEHPGNNKLLQNKLIEVISSSTREKCQPPDPPMVYLWGTSRPRAQDADIVMADPETLISENASRDGLIIALHDLNLSLTDNDLVAFWEFQQRLKRYDNLLTPIFKAKNIPDNKVVKLAIVWDRPLPDKQFPYGHLLGEWTVAGMKKEKDKEAALMESNDESTIRKKVEALLLGND